MRVKKDCFQRFNGSWYHSIEFKIAPRYGIRLCWELNPDNRWYLPKITHYGFIATHFHFCVTKLNVYFTFIHQRSIIS